MIQGVPMKFLTYSLLALVLVPSSLFAATLTGTVNRSDSTTKVIAGAKVVALLNNAKVDSTTTNASGQYILTLTAGTTYALQFSAVGYKDNLGYANKNVTTTLVAGTNILDMNLTPATSTIRGAISFIVVNSLAPPLMAKTEADPVTKIVLQRQAVSNGSWLALDSSTFSGATYFTYGFFNLISTTGGASGGYYRLRASRPNYSQLETADSNLIVTMGDTTISNIIMFPTSAIYPTVSGHEREIHFTRQGNRLLLDFEISGLPRSIKIFDLNGAFQHQVYIPAGKTQVYIPATFAPENGFFFILK